MVSARLFRMAATSWSCRMGAPVSYFSALGLMNGGYWTSPCLPPQSCGSRWSRRPESRWEGVPMASSSGHCTARWPRQRMRSRALPAGRCRPGPTHQVDERHLHAWPSAAASAATLRTLRRRHPAAQSGLHAPGPSSRGARRLQRVLGLRLTPQGRGRGCLVSGGSPHEDVGLAQVPMHSGAAQACVQRSHGLLARHRQRSRVALEGVQLRARFM